MRILVVEDEIVIAKNIKNHLSHEGYAVDMVHDGLEAIDYLHMSQYDIVILDIMLPHLDGLTILKTIKQHDPQTKVLLLSARNRIEDRVEGLDLGADDYMIKPFSLEELSARIRVLTRRMHVVQTILSCHDITLNTSTKRVLAGNREVKLTAKEYAILEYLLLNKGTVISRDQLLEHVWSYDYDGVSNIIDVYVRTIRKKLSPYKVISTLRGIGYVIKDEEQP